MSARKGGGRGADNIDITGWNLTGEEKFDETNPYEVSVRRAFIARPGYKLVSFDYSQMEMRVFFSYIGNPEIMRRMEEDGFDFHVHTAKVAFGVDETHPNFKFYRQMAKASNFGAIFGLGLEKFAQQMDLSLQEAEEYRKQYLTGVKGAQEFISKARRTAKQRGYIFNRYGRRYWIPPGREYIGVNYLVQGTSADIMKETMVAFYGAFNKQDIWPILQVHDEIIAELPEDNYMDIAKQGKALLEMNSIKLPLRIDIGLCEPSWAHKRDVKV